jgi:hypothetical protein
VYENFYVELYALFKGKLNWRKAAKEMARYSINAIFPDSESMLRQNAHTTIAQRSSGDSTRVR